jgi:hypothetical protein
MPERPFAVQDEAPTPEVTGDAPQAPVAPRSREVATVRWEQVALCSSIVLAVLVPLLGAIGARLPGQIVLVLLYALAVPGVPLVSLLRIRNPLVAASMAGALSLSCLLLSANTAVITGWWDPVAWTAGMSVLSVGAAAAALRRLQRLPEVVGAPDGEAPPVPRRWSRGRVGSLALLAAALLLWWIATRSVRLADAGAFGLISVVGWQYLAALGIVAVVAAVELRRAVPDALVLGGAAVVLAVTIFLFVNAVSGVASVPVGWTHVGFIRYITEHHATFSSFDARGDWPAFFAAGAQLVQLAGAPDASVLLAGAPLFANIAVIAPLLVIARRVTQSERLAWFAVLLYLCNNWFQQDYFSPQATAFLLYTAMLAYLFEAAQWSEPPPPGRLRERLSSGWRRRPALPPGVSPHRSMAHEFALVLIAAAIVVTHQLTPVMLVLTLLAFTVTGRTRYRRLWLVVALLFLGWFSYGAEGFWVGHLKDVIGDFGRVGANLNSAVNARLGVNESYQLMQRVRVGYSLAYLLLGMVGLWRIRHRPGALLLALLVVGAGSIVLLQSYGGEVVLRIFVFAAPVLAPLSALALAFLAERRMSVLPLALVLFAYTFLGTTTRGVNASFEQVTPQDLSAVQVLYPRIRPGDTVGVFADAGPLGSNRIGQIHTVDLDAVSCHRRPLDCALTLRPRFILVSPEQDAALELVEGARPGTASAVSLDLVSRGIYAVDFRRNDTMLLELVPKAGRP